MNEWIYLEVFNEQEKNQSIELETRLFIKLILLTKVWADDLCDKAKILFMIILFAIVLKQAETDKKSCTFEFEFIFCMKF